MTNREDWTAVLCETDAGCRPRSVGRSSGFKMGNDVLARLAHHADPWWTKRFTFESARLNGGVATLWVD